MSQTELQNIKETEPKNEVCIPIAYRELIRARYVIIYEYFKKNRYIGNNSSTKYLIRAVKIFLTASKKSIRSYYRFSKAFFETFKDDAMNNGELLNGISLVIAVRLQGENPDNVTCFYEEVDGEHTVVLRYFGEKVYLEEELKIYTQDCTGKVPFLPTITERIKSATPTTTSNHAVATIPPLITQNNIESLRIKQYEGENAESIPESYNPSLKARAAFIFDFFIMSGYLTNHNTSEEIIAGVKNFITKSKEIPHGLYFADKAFRAAFEADDNYNGGLLESISLLIGTKLVSEYQPNVKCFYEVTDGKRTVVLRYFCGKIYLQRELELYSKACSAPEPFLSVITQQVKTDAFVNKAKQTDVS